MHCKIYAIAIEFDIAFNLKFIRKRNGMVSLQNLCFSRELVELRALESVKWFVEASIVGHAAGLCSMEQPTNVNFFLAL